MKPSRTGFSVFLFIMFLLGYFTFGGETQRVEIFREPLSVPKIEDGIEIDGSIDEDLWEKALKLPLRYEVLPGENTPAPVSTYMYLAYTDKAVVVAFKCYDDNPTDIRARFSDRDKAFEDDFVGIVLDTFNDKRRAYEFFCNPLGVQIDAVRDEIGDEYDTSWNAIWDARGRITEQGYEVEMEIPFSQLRFPQDKGPFIWGIDANRSYPRHHKHRIGLFPLDRSELSYLSQLVKVTGFENISAGTNLEVVPTATAIQTQSANDLSGGDLSNRDTDAELGVSMRWGMTPNTVLNATINPDFSQVEADAVQLDINQNFALFFPETRPFFIEGAEIFRSDINLVHTRNIIDPDAAAKLTGKKGNHTYGVFSARDQSTNIVIPGSDFSTIETFDSHSTTSIGRYRYDLGRNSTVGGLLSNREGNGYYNRVFSLDSTYNFTANDQAWFQGAYAYSRYNQQMVDTFGLEKTDYEGHAVKTGYLHNRRNWYGLVSYEDFSEDFHTTAGYEPQVNYRLINGRFTYIWHGKPTTTYTKIEFSGSTTRSEDQSGNLLKEESLVWGTWQGPLETSISGGYSSRDSSYLGEIYDTDFHYLHYEVRPSKSVWLRAEYNFSEWIDFRHQRPGDLQQYSINARFDLGRHIFTDFNYEVTTMDVQDQELYKTQVSQFRFIYKFNTRLLIRAVVQGVEIDRNAALYNGPVYTHEENLFSQFLFSYKLNPQTVAFIGFDDSFFGNQDLDLDEISRTYFVKLSYAWLR